MSFECPGFHVVFRPIQPQRARPFLDGYSGNVFVPTLRVDGAPSFEGGELISGRMQFEGPSEFGRLFEGVLRLPTYTEELGPFLPGDVFALHEAATPVAICRYLGTEDAGSFGPGRSRCFLYASAVGGRSTMEFGLRYGAHLENTSRVWLSGDLRGGAQVEVDVDVETAVAPGLYPLISDTVDPARNGLGGALWLA